MNSPSYSFVLHELTQVYVWSVVALLKLSLVQIVTSGLFPVWTELNNPNVFLERKKNLHIFCLEQLSISIPVI